MKIDHKKLEEEKINKELEQKLKLLFPNSKIEDGIKYRKWVVFDGLRPVEEMIQCKIFCEANDYFIGHVFKAPVSILFFGEKF